MNHKKCNKCGETYPETRDYFGQYKNKRNGVVKIGFRNTCRKCMAKNTKKWASDNYDNLKEKWTTRNQATADAEGYFGDSDIVKIRKEQCGYCGAALNGGGEIDHKTPVSRGGSNWPDNLILSCLSCNREKGNKTYVEYIEWCKERGLSVI